VNGNFIGRLSGGAVIAAFLLLAIFMFDPTVEVRYFQAKVLAVQYTPQFGLNARAVLVDLGEQDRVIRTRNWQVETRIGARVCVSERKFLLRGSRRYSLTLPFYCPQLRWAPQHEGSPQMLPSG
jgi:hypothetical protein